MTRKEFKVSHTTCADFAQAKDRFDKERRTQRSQHCDNAIVLARLGQVIEERGDADLISELFKNMRSHFRKRKEEEEQKDKQNEEAAAQLMD